MVVVLGVSKNITYELFLDFNMAAFFKDVGLFQNATTISQNQQISLIVVQICILFVLGASNKSHGPILKFQCDGFVQDGHHKISKSRNKTYRRLQSVLI